MTTTGSSRLVKNAMRATEAAEVVVASEGEGEVETGEEEEIYGEDELLERMYALYKQFLKLR